MLIEGHSSFEGHSIICRSFSRMLSNFEVKIQDIQDAAKRIEPYVHKTPVMTSSTLDRMAGRAVHFKCEIFQKIGAFKIRGAMNAVIQLLNSLPDDQRPVLVTHSSGNHAQAIALSSKIMGLQAFIAMPINAPSVKKAAVREYGATIVDCGTSAEDREATSQRILQETSNSYLIPPFDHPHIIAGQGTLGLEILEQVPNLDAIIVPVGGGGMLSGIAIAVKALKPDIKIYAAEPANADDCAKSFAANERIPLQGPPSTIADGLRTSVGHVTWPIIKDKVTDVITVTEEEIVTAMRVLWERMKLLIEPSAAVGVAAILSERFRALPNLRNVAVVLCGGNVDLDNLPWKK
ncbi:serine racemase-like isoform X2 [Pocillopora verrucosa]|uniref:serine racemase-like isoform X2 n=1 Tax=Pocillopora verrucosa TaxID=203993 RepID=UPI00333E56C7